VLLDECVDRRLAADIRGHDVKTVPDAGWASLTNGELLGRAQYEFDVIVTVDRNLPFQQNGALRRMRSGGARDTDRVCSTLPLRRGAPKRR
jgi:hypothetical protein